MLHDFGRFKDLRQTKGNDLLEGIARDALSLQVPGRNALIPPKDHQARSQMG
jgi:hypothetical protein